MVGWLRWSGDCDNRRLQTIERAPVPPAPEIAGQVPSPGGVKRGLPELRLEEDCLHELLQSEGDFWDLGLAVNGEPGPAGEETGGSGGVRRADSSDGGGIQSPLAIFDDFDWEWFDGLLDESN